MNLHILDIIRGTTVDGPGFRTSIYMAGCKHQCDGCHNPQSWDFKAGTLMSLDKIIEIIEEEDFDVTLTGGDPLYHPLETKALIDKVLALGHTVWVYTGFTMEEIENTPVLRESIEGAEAIVDGKFDQSLYDPDLKFRGSSNQRIIYL